MREDLRAGIRAGVIAATATAGTMIAIGMRSSTAARPFNVVASHLLGRTRADVWGFVAPVTITGVALHVVLTCVVGITVAMVVRRRLMAARLAAPFAALFCAMLSIGMAKRGSASLASLFVFGDLIVFYVTLAIALVVGIRLALPTVAADTHRHMHSM